MNEDEIEALLAEEQRPLTEEELFAAYGAAVSRHMIPEVAHQRLKAILAKQAKDRGKSV